jgi:hypothetical protein
MAFVFFELLLKIIKALGICSFIDKKKAIQDEQLNYFF